MFDQSIEETTDNSGAVISTETLTRVAVDQARLELMVISCHRGWGYDI